MSFKLNQRVDSPNREKEGEYVPTPWGGFVVALALCCMVLLSSCVDQPTIPDQIVDTTRSLYDTVDMAFDTIDVNDTLMIRRRLTTLRDTVGDTIVVVDTIFRQIRRRPEIDTIFLERAEEALVRYSIFTDTSSGRIQVPVTVPAGEWIRTRVLVDTFQNILGYGLSLSLQVPSGLPSENVLRTKDAAPIRLSTISLQVPLFRNPKALVAGDTIPLGLPISWMPNTGSSPQGSLQLTFLNGGNGTNGGEPVTFYTGQRVATSNLQNGGRVELISRDTRRLKLRVHTTFVLPYYINSQLNTQQFELNIDISAAYRVD